MIHIMTALRCEAIPLIDAFRLQHQRSCRAFNVYQNDSIRLIISGTGKLAAAAATAFLASRHPDENHASWLNIGMAGHPDLATGVVRLADRITDHGSGRYWYPGLVGLTTPACPLLTVDTVQDNFITDACHDMEGSGFFSAARRFAGCDNIQCLKVVSDNRSSHHDKITAAIASRLISERLDEIAHVIDVLQRHSAIMKQQQPELDETAQFTDRWHFSTTQQHRLQHLLQRWHALRPAESALASVSALTKTVETTHVLDTLQQLLDETAVEYRP